jgi:hypothetical protein
MPSLALADPAVGNGSSPYLNQVFTAPYPLSTYAVGVGIGQDLPLTAFSSSVGAQATIYQPPLASALVFHLPAGSSVSYYVSYLQAGSQAGAQGVTQTYTNSGTNNLDTPWIYINNKPILNGTTPTQAIIWTTNVSCGSAGAQTTGCPSYRWL